MNIPPSGDCSISLEKVGGGGENFVRLETLRRVGGGGSNGGTIEIVGEVVAQGSKSCDGLGEVVVLMVLITFVVVKMITILAIILLLRRLKGVLVVSVVLEVKRMALSLRLILRVVISLERVQLERDYLNLLFQ